MDIERLLDNEVLLNWSSGKCTTWLFSPVKTRCKTLHFGMQFYLAVQTKISKT